MNKETLSFSLFIIHAMANRFNISPVAVYHKLKSTACLEKYIIPYYDILHTQGEDYLIQDIENYLKNRGVLL
ncbi:MAG: DUF3791 domain-containing protein [Neisseriaceae bacterium]|nr:DUF3791 domain-containing protein [Neisseriaceae bacterium]